jgi:energy-coupling factor transport system ATP-binding protein
MQTDNTDKLADTQSDKIIKTQNLRYAYKTTEEELPKIVLEDLDLEIEAGTFVAILGRNGSGKTTLAKHFNAILLPMAVTCSLAGWTRSTRT